MKLKDIKLTVCKYRVRRLVLKYGKNKKHDVATTLITRISLVENFDQDFLPFLTISMYLPSNIFREITSTKNKNKVTAVLNIQKAKFKSALAMSPDEKATFSKCINGRFHCVIGSKDMEATQQEQKLVEKSDSQYGQLKLITLSLYPKKYYENFQKVVNAVIESCTLTDAMVYIFQNAKLDKMLVSPPENKKRYTEFKLLPIQAAKMLDRICSTYAFHKKGSIIYFGFDKGYIINKIPKCTAYVKNEIKNTYIVVFTTSKGIMQTGGCYTNKQKKYYVLNASDISADNAKNVTKKMMGEKTIIIDKNGSKKKIGSGKVTNVLVKEEGESNPKDISRTIKERSKAISCQLIHADLSMIRPNKLFIVSADAKAYKKYNGKYRIVSASHVFEKEGDYFSLTSVISLVSGK